MSHPSAGRRLAIIAGVVVLALVVGGAGLYWARNPERSELTDAARQGAPGQMFLAGARL